MTEITKEYSNGEVTIVWKPKSCIHAANCVKGLPNVFQPKDKPWIKVDAASTEDLIQQVKKCPSGALSYYRNEADNTAQESLETRVEVLENGPLIVHGKLQLTHADGSQAIKNNTTAFCRCGVSQNKPYCDGSHVKAGFTG